MEETEPSKEHSIKRQSQNEKKGMLLGLFAIGAFGLTLPATRVLLAYMDPLFIGLGRAVFAALCAGFLLLWFRQKIPNPAQLQQLLLVSLGVVVGFPVLSSWAMQYVPASHGGVVLGIVPLATAAAGALIANERPSFCFWLVGVTGGGLVIWFSLIHGGGHVHMADLALLAATLSAAVGYAVGARLAKVIGGWQVICWALVLALPVALAPAVHRAPEAWADLPLIAYVCFLYLALVSQLLAFFIWYGALALGGIARVSQVQLLQPFVTVLASVLLLRESVDVVTLVFVLLVACIVWIGKATAITEKTSRVSGSVNRL